MKKKTEASCFWCGAPLEERGCWTPLWWPEAGGGEHPEGYNWVGSWQETNECYTSY